MVHDSKDLYLPFEANNYPLSSGVRLIEASAGTGKTFALAHLVLRLITEGQVSVDKLLIITFTNSAAAELRSRIGARLELALLALENIQSSTKSDICYDSTLLQWVEKQRVNDIKCNICDKRRGDNLVYVGGEMILRPFPRNAEEDIILCYASKNSR